MDKVDNRTVNKPFWPARLALAFMLLSGAWLIIAMSVKPISAADLGYHLAYGTHYLNTGEIVQDARFISPHPSPQNAQTDKYPLAPGASFDSNGKYHFPNANWLSQYFLALCWQTGYWQTLNFLLAWLIIMIALGQLFLVYQLRISAIWAVVSWLVLCLVGHERFLLRPELFAFAVLIWQLAIMAGKKMTKLRAFILLALQILAANLHSYWLLSVIIAGAFAVDFFIKAYIPSKKSLPDDARFAKRQFAARTVLTILMLLCAAVHPCGFSNILFPVKTLRYISQNHISGQNRQQVTENLAKSSNAGQSAAAEAKKFHPWQTIGEFHSPFYGQASQSLAGKSFRYLLIAAAIAAVLLIWQRKWAMLLVLLAMCWASCSMRRNIIIAAVTTGPVICLALATLIGRAKLRPTGSRAVVILVALALTAVNIIFSLHVTSGKFYYLSGRAGRFGTGPSAVAMPIHSCRTLSKILINAQPVFVNQSATSNVVFFSSKVTSSLTLTNTWATPPAFMARSIDICSGNNSIEQLSRLKFEAAVIQAWPENIPLIKRLNASPDWALVDIDGQFCTFILRNISNSIRLSRYEIFRDSLDIDTLIAEMPENPIDKAMKLRATASTLQHILWNEHAVTLWEKCVETPVGAQIASNWLNYGVTLARKNGPLAKLGDPAARKKLILAREAFQKALELDEDYAQARANLARVERDLQPALKPLLK